MCKRWALLLMLLTLMITTGCSSPMHFNDSHMDIYKRIHHTYSRMTSYTAEVKLTVKSNKTENTYLLTQDVKVPHMSALTIKEPSHMEGLKTVINGDKVLIFAKNAVARTNNQLLPNNFVIKFKKIFCLVLFFNKIMLHISPFCSPLKTKRLFTEPKSYKNL